MRTKDSVYLKQVGQKCTGSFSQLMFFICFLWNFVADYSTISDSGALLIERISVSKGISILVPSSGISVCWWFLFRQGKSSNLPKGMNSFWGYDFWSMTKMNYIEYTMGTHISFIFTGHFTHIFRPYNLHFSVGSWGPEAVIYH